MGQLAQHLLINRRVPGAVPELMVICQLEWQLTNQRLALSQERRQRQ